MDSSNLELPENKIFRFKFDEQTLLNLHNFAKLHQFDDRITFKEAWKVWIESNQTLINYESRRLDNLGYIGDVENKMFKSARYYLKNKSSEPKNPVQRRNYVSMSNHILSLMDEHINQTVFNEEQKSPADSYNKFCIQFQSNILSEINRLMDLGLSGEDIKIKIKKTFKNRYFRLTKK